MKRKLCYGLILSLLLVSGCGKTETATPTPDANAAVEASVEETTAEETPSEEASTTETTEEVKTVSNITVTDNRNKTSSETTDSLSSTQPAATNVTVTDEDFDVQEYLLETKFGSSYYSRYYLVITNNAEVPVKISGNGTAYDAAGAAIGAGNMSIEIIGPGETSIGYFFFDGVSGIDKVDYQLSYDTTPHYYPCIGNLAMQQTLNNKNVTITLTNNGDTAAQFVEATALFFDADHNLIYTNTNYVVDGDHEIKPGATLSGQLDIYNGEYDHVEIYLTGRASGQSSVSSKATASVSDEDFDVVEHLYETKFGSMYYLIITNNSTEVVDIKINGTAYDAGGNSIGAANTNVDVLGPEETTAAYLYFNGVTGIDKVDYSMSYGSETTYSPVISNLSVEATMNDKNVVLAVTNTGSYAAKFVEARVLFFDADNNLIYQASDYIVDGDHEIKPEATISKQIKSSKAYDHVEIYLDGRG